MATQNTKDMARRSRSSSPAALRRLNATTHESLSHAQRYIRFAKVMRRTLPIAAGVIAATVAIYALQPRDTGSVALTFEQMDSAGSDRTMIRPRLTGTGSVTFVVTADRAVEEGEDGAVIRLVNVEAELTLKNGSTLKVMAPEGIIERDGHMLHVLGGIRLNSGDGYSARTESAHADLRTGIVSGDHPIEAEGALGRVTAQSFTFDTEANRLQFLGAVEMILSGASS